ncbi:unnamed protein product [Linum trigynum]
MASVAASLISNSSSSASLRPQPERLPPSSQPSAFSPTLPLSLFLTTSSFPSSIPSLLQLLRPPSIRLTAPSPIQLPPPPPQCCRLLRLSPNLHLLVVKTSISFTPHKCKPPSRSVETSPEELPTFFRDRRW